MLYNYDTYLHLSVVSDAVELVNLARPSLIYPFVRLPLPQRVVMVAIYRLLPQLKE